MLSHQGYALMLECLLFYISPTFRNNSQTDLWVWAAVRRRVNTSPWRQCHVWRHPYLTVPRLTRQIMVTWLMSKLPCWGGKTTNRELTNHEASFYGFNNWLWACLCSTGSLTNMRLALVDCNHLEAGSFFSSLGTHCEASFNSSTVRLAVIGGLWG